MTTGALVPPACRTWACSVCGPRRTRRLARALDHAGYHSFVTLTRVPSDGRQGLARMRYLIALEQPFEWAWTIEDAPKTGMRHVHAVCRTAFFPQARLSKLAQKAGFGEIADIRAARPDHAGYASKAEYAVKRAGMSYEDRLTANGGKRPWHWSRGYTGGVPMRSFVRMHPPSADPGPWVPVSSDEAKRLGVLVLVARANAAVPASAGETVMPVDV